MLNLLIIIQARMTSTRLPKKVLLPLCGKTVLEVMIERLGDLKENIIIATTNDGSEAEIVTLCQKLGVKYYRGDTENVLSRYYEAAMIQGVDEVDTIVRLTSDCPLIDKAVVEKTIALFYDGEYDYVSNTMHRTFPRGLDTEVFSFRVLKEAYDGATSIQEKEHVTTYIHTTHREHFNLGSYQDPQDNSKYRLTLDEEADYTAIKTLYEKFNCKIDFDYDALIKVLHANPFIYEINKEIEQKKL
ncbi:MAG: glycosyltransferase family protein [Epsilonproteobacteria bacterium]|nr:glycosyltransferase family protein [Campylobacterota bacterium]